MTRIIGRVVGPDGRPAHGWVRLRPQQPAARVAAQTAGVTIIGWAVGTADALATIRA